MSTSRVRTQLNATLVLAGALASGLFSGCEGRSLEDDLRMSIADQGQTVVDLSCDSCPTWIDVNVFFDPDATLVDDDEVVLEQYRVDYDLKDLDGAPPFLAGVLEQHVRPDDDASFLVNVAGSAQRAHVREASAGDDVEGRATLTLAGYDSDDQQVFVEKAIAIRFEHRGSAAEEPAP